MYQREAARYRVEDMVRDAEAYRRSQETRTARSGAQHGALRRMASAAIALVVWPIRH